MQKTIQKKALWGLLFMLFQSICWGQNIVHYWNFNDNSSVNAITTVSQTLLTGATITAIPGGTSQIDLGGTGQNFDIENINAQNGDAAGTHLRFNNPIGGGLEFALPTLGFENMVVKFATRRSGSGAGNQLWSYTTNGTDYVSFATIVITEIPTLQTLDFTAITAANNNPNFKLKVEFEAGSGGAVGNNRFDNFTMQSGTTNNTSVSFASNFITVNEAAGTLNFIINLESPSTASVDLVVKSAPFSTADANDFTLTTQTVQFTGGSSLTQTITIPIIDDALEEQQAEYVVLSLENPVGLSISGNSFATIYILDNDRLAPVPSQEIELNYVGSFDPSGTNSSTCEIVVHDPTSQRLFTTSAVAGFLDIIDFSNPTSPQVINSIDINPYGGVTSVAVKNGIVAVASPNADETLNGSVLFFDTNGAFINQVIVGALPDMITFSPDGTKVMTANEGQPNTNYSIDPEGSVSIIDISGGVENLTQSQATTLLFTDYNSQEATLIASGVRKLKLTSTMSQDFEPEFITISADSQNAWVTLQENNAIAEINLATNSIVDVWALGTKDMSLPGNGFDASDNNNEILIANWPVQSYYIPDAMASFTVGATTYLVTANEGDEKEYTGFEERTTVGAGSYVLDAANYPNASVLKASHNLGRFRVTNLDGNTDLDTDYEQIYSLGARSFSIFNTDTKAIVFDSGDDFEMYTAANFASIFNADHEENTPKVRSRAKGPEPEGVTIATIANRVFAFISLERVGGVMVYNVTNPNAPVFVDYKNTRSTSSYAGDHGAEGITYITPENSPTSNGYIIVANEISGTLTIFEVDNKLLSNPEFNLPTAKTFAVFPNPSNNGMVYFNRVADVTLYDVTGKQLLSKKQATSLETALLPTGIYILTTSEGITKRIIIK